MDPSDAHAAAMARPPDPDTPTIAALTARVTEALAMADALGLGFVGIDLCSALERLKDIAAGADRRDY